MVKSATLGGTLDDRQQLTAQILDTVRRFVEREVIPVESGGLGLDCTTYSMIVEELCRGWMSLSGVLNTHLMFAFVLGTHGTREQRERFLPAMARGEHRAALCLTEPHAGSDT